MKRTFILLMFFILAVGSRTTQAEEISGAITLQQAQSIALRQNPELSAFLLEVRAREAQVQQAGFLPNPQLSFEVENFGGTGDFRGFDSAEFTVQAGQMFELGGKRSRRVSAAVLEKDVANWDLEARKLDLLSDVTKAFIEVLTAQERLALQKELVRLSEEVFSTISARVQAGKVSPVEETKAGITLASVRIDMERSNLELEAARKSLTVFWGSASPAFEKADGQLELLEMIPSFDQLIASLPQNPDIARWYTEIEQKKALLKIEEANRIPDPSLNVGYRRLQEPGINSFIAGISIPLPLFNRNQGGIAAAVKRIARAEEDGKTVKLKVLSALSEAYQALSSAYIEALTIKDRILPGAINAFEATKEGYLQGKFNYLDVLDSQRTLFEAKNRYIEVLAAYHRAFSDVKRLTGVRVDNITELVKENS